MSDTGQKALRIPRSKNVRLGVVAGIFALALAAGYLAWRLFSLSPVLAARPGLDPALPSAPVSAALPGSASPQPVDPTLTPTLAPSLTPPLATPPLADPVLADPVMADPVIADPAKPLAPPGALLQGLVILALDDGLYTHLFAYSPNQLPLLRLTSGDWDDIHPALHPDGTRLAFASNRDGDWDLYWMDLASGAVTQVTNTPEYDASPSWSPDGLWLAYESYVPSEEDGNLEIFIRPLDSSSPPIPLSGDPAADHSPAWSPQGRMLAFISTRSGDSEVWLADLDKVDDRFTNLSRDARSVEAHPVWSPDGGQLAWSSSPASEVQLIKIWDASHPAGRPRSLNSGDWPAWSPQGDALLATLLSPNLTHLTGYYLAQGSLSLPLLQLPGAVHGLTWGRAGLPDPLPQTFAQAAAITPTPLWQPVEVPAIDLPTGRVQVMPLVGVSAPMAMLQDRSDEAFYALKDRAAQRAGWDFLTSLEQAYIPLTAPLNPGLMEDWLYTGRAFRFNTAPLNAGWQLVVRQDFGAQTYWRIYLRARFQDGSQGLPLKELPWNLSARLSGDPVAYEQGGRLETVMPPGYWVDFTRLAAAYGWERLPALSTWRVSYSGTRYDEFVLRQGLDWMSAMLEIYPKAALDTPTPVSSPTNTVTPSITPTPTTTPTWTRRPSITPTPTWTRRPTRTPTPTSTRRPTRTPVPSNTPRWTPTLAPSATPAPVSAAPVLGALLGW